MSEPGLGTLLRALIDRLDAAVQEGYREAGFNYRPRFTPIIRHLEERGPSSLRVIADAVGVSHSAISQTVAEMERADLIRKGPGADGREQLCALTGIAHAMLPALHAYWERIEVAVRDLNGDVGCDLAKVIETTLQKLEQRSFQDRIKAAPPGHSAENPSPELAGTPRGEERG